MITLKKLVIELDKRLKSGDELDRAVLQSLVDDALAYLNRAKHFEHKGSFKLPSVALKMVELNMDLDDVIKELVDKRSDIEFEGELALTIEKVGGKDSTKKAA